MNGIQKGFSSLFDRKLLEYMYEQGELRAIVMVRR